jgi:hypothetical protein
VPGVVTIVSARTGGGSGEVELTWEALANATRYRVFAKTAPDLVEREPSGTEVLGDSAYSSGEL